LHAPLATRMAVVTSGGKWESDSSARYSEDKQPQVVLGIALMGGIGVSGGRSGDSTTLDMSLGHDWGVSSGGDGH